MNKECYPDDADRLLSDPEFRRRLGGIGRTKAWQMRRDGEVRYVRITSRRIAYPASEVCRLIAERMAGGHTDRPHRRPFV
ncbi:putative DNA-binding transcriptional regulator AlpA [Methylobacterium sp. R2-1]|nr:putative DNA-binding transcriptional regulator AlpA [Methylobacterium sp. R2-1]